MSPAALPGTVTSVCTPSFPARQHFTPSAASGMITATGVVSTVPSPSVSPGICPSTAKSTLFPGLAGLLPLSYADIDTVLAVLYRIFRNINRNLTCNNIIFGFTVYVIVSVVLSGRVTVKVISAPSTVPAGKVTSACKPSFSSSAFA